MLIGEKIGEGRGVHLSPALTSSFIWSVNSKWGEEGEREGKEERDLVGVSGGEAGGPSKVLWLLRGMEACGDPSSS